jgi:hypothetical protein
MHYWLSLERHGLEGKMYVMDETPVKLNRSGRRYEMGRKCSSQVEDVFRCWMFILSFEYSIRGRKRR